MTTITSYRDLHVWQKAMILAERVYAITRDLPKQEEYRLTSQLIRAAVSIPANIAEGFMRSTRKDYRNFVSIARGSAAELETLLMLAARVKIAPESTIRDALVVNEDVSRMLNVLHQKLKPLPKSLKPKTKNRIPALA